MDPPNTLKHNSACSLSYMNHAARVEALYLICINFLNCFMHSISSLRTFWLRRLGECDRQSCEFPKNKSPNSFGVSITMRF